jgi:hypothetical protein
MFRYKGGQKAGRGTYWNMADGKRMDIKEEDVLPGGEKTVYYRMPAILMLLAVPLIGLLYVVLLPFIAIGTVMALAAGKVFGGLVALVGKSISFGWRPAVSYLSGRKKKQKK